MKISDLKARTTCDEITLKVIEKMPVRDFTSSFGKRGKVCDAKCTDDNGDAIILTLWNDDIDQVEANQKIKITNGWVSEWQGRMQISRGKAGKMEVIESVF